MENLRKVLLIALFGVWAAYQLYVWDKGATV